MAGRRILVVGSGGREHVLGWRLARDPETAEVILAPGNQGMARVFRCFPVAELDAPGLLRLCREQGVDLVVVGPEAPLAAGVADVLRSGGIAVFGPDREAARLESSKWFAKEVMARAGVPTAHAEAFEDPQAAREALNRFGPPFVVKADGLAAGKGVRVAETREEAASFLTECLEVGRFGASGRRVVIEEFLRGEEASLMAVCDGADFVLLPAARDYKRAFDGDRGTNTGGMGSYAPAAAFGPALEAEAGRGIVAPVLAEMARRGTPYRGVLYCGLMLQPAGPRVVEFNCRFGDPESQCVLPLAAGDFGRLLNSAAAGALERDAVGRAAGAAVSVALADEGYPDAVRGGGTLLGLEAVMKRDDLMVFHAASRLEQGRWRVAGGRAAHVAAVGGTRAEARERVYAALAGMKGDGWRYRRDIAAPEPEGVSAAGRGAEE